MIICFFPFLVFATEIYTEVNGDESDFCHILQPCSFSRAKENIKNDDIVFIKGDYIGGANELNMLGDLFNYGLSKGVTFLSDNLTINGSEYQSNSLSFIIVQGATNSRIHNFHFTCFHTTIACFRTVEKGVFSDTTFTHNHVKNGIGLLCFGVGKCKLDNCYISENSVTNTSLISMFSTHLYLNMTIIERNHVLHNTRQSLLFAINSVCEYTNTTIRNNVSPFSPLHRFEFRSCFGFWNCTFENNNHPEIMLCDGTCEFNFTNTSVLNNNGVFLATSIGSIVTINKTEIINNFSGKMPLFYLPGGNFYVSTTSTFKGNIGNSLVDLKGTKSLIDIRKVKFIRNKMNDFIMSFDFNSNVHIQNSIFNANDVMNGAILENINSSLKIEETKFSGNKNVDVNLSNNAFVDMFHCVFKNNSNIYIKADETSKVTVSYSNFYGINFFDIKGHKILKHLKTNNSDNLNESNNVVLSLVLLLVIVMLLGYILFRKKFEYCLKIL